MPEQRSDGDLVRRFLLLPLVVVEAARTGYLIVDAAGTFTLPAGQSPREIWLFVAGFLSLFLTVVVCCALAAVPSLGRPTLGWLLAPLCAAFLAAFFYSYDHGADGLCPSLRGQTFKFRNLGRACRTKRSARWRTHVSLPEGWSRMH